MDPYITIDDADTYFSERLRTSAWDNTSDSGGDKLKALLEATRMIDRLNFAGTKTSSTQENEFPRNDETTVPIDIQYACAEIAIKLLDGIDPDMEVENLMMSAQGISTLKTTYNRSSVQENVMAGIPSMRAWMFLKPYLIDPETITISRVS